MAQLSYRRHRFPASIVQHSIWLYLRFTLSYRDVKDLLAERGLDISYETVRRWVLKFGPSIARKLRHASCGRALALRAKLAPAFFSRLGPEPTGQGA
jgi:putative transposase